MTRQHNPHVHHRYDPIPVHPHVNIVLALFFIVQPFSTFYKKCGRLSFDNSPAPSSPTYIVIFCQSICTYLEKHRAPVPVRVLEVLHFSAQKTGRRVIAINTSGDAFFDILSLTQLPILTVYPLQNKKHRTLVHAR